MFFTCTSYIRFSCYLLLFSQELPRCYWLRCWVEIFPRIDRSCNSWQKLSALNQNFHSTSSKTSGKFFFEIKHRWLSSGKKCFNVFQKVKSKMIECWKKFDNVQEAIALINKDDLIRFSTKCTFGWSIVWTILKCLFRKLRNLVL